MSSQITTFTTPYDMEAVEFTTALQRRQSNRSALLSWIKDHLVEGTDFGKIHVVGKLKCGAGKNCVNPHHFSKPVLFKAGSEKILGMLGVAPHFPHLHEYVQAALSGVEFKQIIIHCQLQSADGRVLAEGIGARSLQQDSGDINKAMKMAEKSAHIDATLRLAGLSEIFTQDLEDTPPKDEGDNEPVYRVTDTQLRKLAARLKGYDLPAERVLKWCRQKWGVETLETLTYEQFQELDSKLEKFADTVKSERSREPISGDHLRKLTGFLFQHSMDLIPVLRKSGIDRIEDLTYANLDEVWKIAHASAERKSIQNENSPPIVQVIPGSEADLLLERAKQIRTAAKYSDGQSYYRDLEEAQNLESAARKLLIEGKDHRAEAPVGPVDQAVGDAS